MLSELLIRRHGIFNRIDFILTLVGPEVSRVNVGDEVVGN